MDVINKLNIPNKIFVTDEDVTIFVDKPFVLGNLPSIDISSINDKYLKIETHKTILEYFNDLLDSNWHVVSIDVLNGINLTIDNNVYYCDYCKTDIEDNWYYCYHCNKDMCKFCYEETSEEIALKNGAKNKNYKNREEALNKCHSCKLIEPRNIYNIIKPINGRTCNLCEEEINIHNNFYSVIINDCGRTYDICAVCYQKSNEARNIVETKSMRLIDINDKSNYYFGHTGFESMLYWFPIISDTECCRVFINLNPNDTNYGKICLQSRDSHDRFGYFIVRDEKYDLQKILERLKEICDKGTYEYSTLQKVEDGVYGEEVEVVEIIDGWKTTKRETIKEPKYEWVTKTAELCKIYHSSPIQILMQELNMPVYYG